MAPPIRRLRQALQPDSNASRKDVAVLVRHALRYELGQTGAQPSLWLPFDSSMPSERDWESVGISARIAEGGHTLRARPWRPNWLPDVPPNGVDGAASSEEPRRTHLDAEPDPLLKELRYNSYKSEGQRVALRSALIAPAGSTLAVSLRTGEGKSLVFQAIARLGYAGGRKGVTLVVTPTVALSLDHEQSARQLQLGDGPLAYRGGAGGQNDLIAERIGNGEQVICFASPEAVCGRLRRPLELAAEAGRIRALVVDEAHLIDSWGINFRPDFQMLAGLRRQLLRRSTDQPFRTILLSATLTADAIKMLKNLFPPVSGAPFGLVSSAALRPEIDYWISPLAEGQQRIERTLEAVHHLPRPLILYTTERWMAQDWYRRISAQGFNRVGVVTGETPRSERERTIEGWRSGRIDLAIGTSAFGLGIDNPEVRAVIHACVPETLDRFYQEVGRGGRDGSASVSLMMPIARDFGIAKGLSRKRLLRPETSRRRWRSMFEHPDRTELGAGRYRLRVDIRPDVDHQYIDMVNATSTAWNMRTLVLMAAVGAITIEEIDRELIELSESSRDDNGQASSGLGPGLVTHHYATVRIDEPMHMTTEFWENHIPQFREQQDALASASLDQLMDFLKGRACSADAIAPIYEIPPDSETGIDGVWVARACGGCARCRRKSTPPFEEIASVPDYPWGTSHDQTATQTLVGQDGHLVVCLPEEGLDASDHRREIEALQRLILRGFRNVVALPGCRYTPTEIQANGTLPTIFVARTLTPMSLPRGPTLVMAGPGTRLSAASFTPRDKSEPRVWLVPASIPHPERMDQSLCERIGVRVVPLSEFTARMLR